MADIFTKFNSEGNYEAYLISTNHPKRGTFKGKPAPDDKQQTVRPYEAQQTGNVVIVKSDVSIDFAPSTEITKAEAQALGAFLDPIEEGEE